MIFLKRMLSVFCLLLAVIFKFGFSTEGVDIYTVKDGKVYILLGQRSNVDEEWADFAGIADQASDFYYAAECLKIELCEADFQADLSALHYASQSSTEYKYGPYLRRLIGDERFANFLFKHAAARMAHSGTMGVFYKPGVPNPDPEKNSIDGANWFLERFYESHKIDVVIPGTIKYRKHHVWFVRVDFIPEEQFASVLDVLQICVNLPNYFVSRRAYKWLAIENLLIESGNLQNAKILNLAKPFYQMLITPEAQKLLKEIMRRPFHFLEQIPSHCCNISVDSFLASPK